MILRPATPHDCLDLAPRLRSCDVAELDLEGTRPVDALRYGLSHGALCEAITTNTGLVVGVWGVVPLEPNAASIWMVGSPEIERISRSFIRACRPAIERAYGIAPTLFASAWAENHVHLNWLRWLGFKPLASKGPYLIHHHV
ncbi:hypothetical protein ASC87_19910 [Rhizobacter sp. Root1221]|nr:hypothetical protein ASC87_19910 [Rhizobacter sp. Root1221]